MRYKSDTEITDAEIKASLIYVAGLIERQGDTYWPLVERLDHELLKRRKRARRLKRLLKSSDQMNGGTSRFCGQRLERDCDF